ncbi:UNVERIFIED_CONTAM: hypothetical protein Sindi_3031000, partial [Sesamum indicum]
FERVTLALIIVQKIIDEIVVTLTVFSFVTKYLTAPTARRRLRRARTYVVSSRIPDQIHHLHRLVSIFDESCLRNLRVDRNAFGRLCYMFQYSVIKLYNVLLARPTPITDECVDSRWKWFKGCLGALDGTFINVHVPEEEKGRCRSRKGHVAVNVLGVCNPNMQFIYMLFGWEGSAADSRILRDAVHRPGGLRIPSGNYYLCDNGYANAEGFLTPYRGVRYHLRDWDTGVQDHRTIRRSHSFYSIKVQTRIILVCCLLHNFLRQEMPEDRLEDELPNVGVEETENDGEIVWNIEPNPTWSNWRDTLATSMYNEWRSHR